MKNGRKLMCPICRKRACDVSDFPGNKFYIELKCPNCKNIVQIVCNEKAFKQHSYNRFTHYMDEMNQ